MAGFFKRRVTKAKGTLSDWMGLGLIAGVFRLVRDIFVTVFMPGKRETEPAETFEEAVVRMKLSKADLEERQKVFFVQTILYLIMGICILGYTVWLAFTKQYTGMFLAFLVAMLSMAYAFRSHFWLFQLKKKKLGCTFKEYLNSSLSS